jgi:hypothetical protein
MQPVMLSRRARFLTVITAACVFLGPWIVFLGFTLPDRYVARQWRPAWIGFDVLLLLALATTAYLVWRRRQMAIISALIGGTLLVCDAWFDTMLSWGTPDFPVAVTTAMVGELPLALLLFGFAFRILWLTVHTLWTYEQLGSPMPSLWKLRMFAIAESSARAGVAEGEK